MLTLSEANASPTPSCNLLDVYRASLARSKYQALKRRVDLALHRRTGLSGIELLRIGHLHALVCHPSRHRIEEPAKSRIGQLGSGARVSDASDPLAAHGPRPSRQEFQLQRL